MVPNPRCQWDLSIPPLPMIAIHPCDSTARFVPKLGTYQCMPSSSSSLSLPEFYPTIWGPLVLHVIIERLDRKDLVLISYRLKFGLVSDHGD